MKGKADYKEQYNDSICFSYLHCMKLFTFLKVSPGPSTHNGSTSEGSGNGPGDF